MAIELKNSLRQIDADIASMDLDSARKRLSQLIKLVEHDKWLDDSHIRETAALTAFTIRSYDKIAERYVNALQASIESAERWDEPFLVRIMPQVLPTDLYGFLSDNFPHQKFLKPRRDRHFVKNGQFQRYETELSDEALKGAGNTVRKLWLGLARAFDSLPVRQALYDAVEAPLDSAHALDIRVMVDRCGFAMPPHTDGGNGGILTFMLYFPQNSELQEHGTEFFRRDGEEFQIVRKREFAANSAHAFRVTSDSWHGLSTPIPEFAERRRSLVVRYIDKR